MRNAVVVDAGPLYAYVDRADAAHRRCVDFVSAFAGTLVVPQLVIAEVAHLVGTRLGVQAELLFLADIAEGAFSTEPVAAADWLRVIELVRKYRDFPLGTVDASVIACAERLQIRSVATLDHRHFAAVHPSHAEAFALLP